jgi:hypothetical protein
VRIRAGTIMPMCAYTCRNDRAYVARGLVETGILRAIKMRPSLDQLEGHDSVYAHTCAGMCMRHSGQLFGTKEGTYFGWFMATIRQSLETHHVLA